MTATMLAEKIEKTGCPGWDITRDGATVTFTEAETPASIREGVGLLDESGPADWRGRIDTELLDIGDARLCVLGQLYHSFEDGRAALGISLRHPYGFCGPTRRLTEAWVGYIEATR